MALLHLTNGTAIIPKIRNAGVPGTIVPWDDVLHEGPVPGGLDPVALRALRAAFLASLAEGEPSSLNARNRIENRWAQRDNALDSALTAHNEVVLWLEHDLYDQLQLIQILDRARRIDDARISAVRDDDYLGVSPSQDFAELFATRRPMGAAECEVAQLAWHAFRAPSPQTIIDVLPRLAALPHLEKALRRHLQQFPSVVDGLSRTEQQACEALRAGPVATTDLYRLANHAREDAVFMGDTTFLWHIAPLLESGTPLLRRTAAGNATPSHPLSFDDTIELTLAGERVLEGQADRVTLCGIDRWLGGVHLRGHGPVWRWDDRMETVTAV